MSVSARIYFWFVTGLGVYTSYATFSDFDIEAFPLFTLLFLFVVSFFAELYEIEVLPYHYVSVSTAIYIGALVIAGSQLALAVVIPSILLSEVVIRFASVPTGASPYAIFQKVIFNTAQVIIAIKLAYIVFNLVGGHSAPFMNAYDYIPPLIAFLVYTLVNTSLVSGIISLTEGTGFFYQLRFNLRNLHVQVLSLGVLAILIAVTYASSPWNLLLIAVLLLMVNQSLREYMELRHQAKQTFEKMMDLLEKRDPYTHEHSESVGDLAEKIAEEMRVNPERKEEIVSAARVHDIGKLGTPDRILLKEDSLNEEEWKIMKEHPVDGADILSEIKIYEGATDIVRHEHERWDGSGYPDGLKGENIPLGSRIVAVADVWNALVTERPYRGALSKEVAVKKIKDMSGVKLDPDVVSVFFSIIEN